MPDRMADCHPDKPHLARGMCNACYRRWWNAENPGRTKSNVQKRRAVGPRATCHPDKPIFAGGMCDARAKNPESSRASSRKYKKAAYWKDPAKYRLRAQAARYGLKSADVTAMLEAQGGLCAVCGEERPLQVDHCHATGVVRALLCNLCNSALGYAKEDASRLRALADYAETWAGFGTPAAHFSSA